MFGVVTVIFFLFNILPGDPAQMMLGQNQNSAQLDVVKKKYGFDKPLSDQYFLYLNDLSPISFHSKKESDYSFFDENFELNPGSVEIMKSIEIFVSFICRTWELNPRRFASFRMNKTKKVCLNYESIKNFCNSLRLWN